MGALPSEPRVREMKERDYLWCLLNQMLDDEEELDRLCPVCRVQAEQTRCPVCATPTAMAAAGVNPAFDMARFLELKGADEE